MIAQELIDAVRNGDIAVMAQLDERGLTPAVDEDAAAFAQRLESLNANLVAMNDQLAENGQYTIEDVTVSAEDAIPTEIFQQPCEITRELYGFACDWVPGFFLNPKFSGLFGGCAFSFFPDFFAMFIVRHSFKDNHRWLWYQRDELLAHELCHVARIGCASMAYEELFAYQTATTGFRRITGGIFRNQVDSFVFLGATLLILISQLLRTFFFTSWPHWPAWIIFAAVLTFLVGRLTRDTRRHRQALGKLTAFYQGQAATARMALFHATDQEVQQLAEATDVGKLVDQWSDAELRWKVVKFRSAQVEPTT